MSSDRHPDDGQAARIEEVRIEDEMEQSYIDYAMSVIAGRALPDVRDGLKPVHRRILYAMHEMGVSSGSGHRKSSSVVGETMGNYHPHGDQAIYDTLVNMAQEFSMRYPLVDGQGNFGSMDGDPAAAMRYTEARMAPIAEELLEDIDRDTVDFQSNYDDRLEEPEVLPASYPNLLVNGSTGIAVGMSTKIPPHNLGEVVDATIKLIDEPDCGVRELIDTATLLPGDGGTDGPIAGSGLPDGCEHRRERRRVGRVHHRSRPAPSARYLRDGGGAERARPDRRHPTPVPGEQSPDRRTDRRGRQRGDDRGNRRPPGRVRPRRGTGGDRPQAWGVSRRGEEPTVGTPLRVDVRCDQPRAGGRPTAGAHAQETLAHYVDHRKEVVTRRTRHELDEAEDRAHILEGRLRALEQVDDVVETIQDSEDRDAAKTALQAGFDLSTEQAAHIVRMQLGSLTSMEAADIESEYEELTDRIERLEQILADESELLGVIKRELRAVKAEYDDTRRTGFVRDAGNVTRADLIPEEEMVVVVTEDDYVKRVPAAEFRAQRRGGKGVIGANPKDGDRVASAFVASTHDTLLCFTDQGQVYQLQTYEVPEYGRTARGTSMVNVLDLDDGEQITAVLSCDGLTGDSYVTMVTREGYLKRTAGEEFANILSTGIRAISLTGDDQLADVTVTNGDQDVVIGTADGMAIRFAETDARPMGRAARGVRGIDLAPDDRVVGLATVADDSTWTLTVTANGYGKRTEIDAYRRQSRNGKGLIDIDTGDRNGPSGTSRRSHPVTTCSASVRPGRSHEPPSRRCRRWAGTRWG
ncbi:MAG: type IIA topoisomerase (DNA gyrase/topo II, topoisomerase IV), A subunit [halophilic archaeon J07HB67]|jgi:DNA gyrase subunit A (EC 5.99.1.3)|nr:MAG: type IIA topoisomerase (DNA gyrase/topo II, topoisomerase IV), A subunit [halophilic archaeon J07HB67]